MNGYHDIIVTSKPTERISYKDPDGIVAFLQLANDRWHVLLTAEQHARRKESKKEEAKLTTASCASVTKVAKGIRVPIHVFGPAGFWSDLDAEEQIFPDGTKIAKADVGEIFPPPKTLEVSK